MPYGNCLTVLGGWRRTGFKKTRDNVYMKRVDTLGLESSIIRVLIWENARKGLRVLAGILLCTQEYLLQDELPRNTFKP